MLNYKIYRSEKQRDWVVFVHGAGGSSAIWFKQVRHFKQYFNLLLLDLRGHGDSPDGSFWNDKREYSFESVSADIIEVLDHENITKAHFVGVSLGTIIIRQLAEMASNRIHSMVLVGAITGFNLKSRFWVAMGRAFRHILPPMWLYKLFARVIMPDARQKESRMVFINEAKKLARKEFLKWFTLTGELAGIFKRFELVDVSIPSLYVMGDGDYLFLEPVKKITEKAQNQLLEVIEHCGHVVNIEKPEIFNQKAIAFLTTISRNHN